MHSEIKNIAFALLAVALLPISYAMLLYGLFKILIAINMEGVAISLLAIIIGIAGELFSEQQKQQLTKKQFMNKILTQTIVMVSLMVTVMVFSYAKNYI